MNSLRSRLALGAFAGTLLIATLAGLLLYWLLRADLIAQLNANTLARAKGLIVLIDYDEDGYQFDWESDGPAHAAALPEYFVIREAAGETLRHSKALAGSNLVWPQIPEQGHSVEPIQLGGGLHAHAVVMRFMPRVDKAARDKPQPLELLVAEPTAGLEAQLDRVGVIVLLTALAAMAIGFFAIWLIVPRALRPLNRIADEIGSRDGRSLTPLNSGPVPRELQAVVAQLNSLLARVSETLQREQEFSAGAAHELRTPLAGIRAKLELALSRTRTPEEYQILAGSTLQIALEMQTLIQSLLQYARGAGAAEAREPESVDAGDFLRQAWRPHAEQAARRNIVVEWLPGDGVEISTRTDLLSVVAQNLFSNAVSYVNEGGRVTIECTGSQAGVKVKISNTGCQLPPESAKRVFEPFWRGDAARSGGDIHAGLGLAITKRMVSALGAAIDAEITGDLFAVILHLPRENRAN